MDRAFVALLYIISTYPDSHGTLFRFLSEEAGQINAASLKDLRYCSFDGRRSDLIEIKR
jgi:hypothetical protein